VWLILAAAAFLLAVATVTVWTRGRLNVPGDPTALGRYGLQDFRDAIYYPVVAVLDGQNPYDAADYLRRYPVGTPMRLYLPAMLCLYLPLGLLPYAVAEAAFFALNVALVPVLVHQGLRLAGVASTAPRVLGLGTFVVLSRPGLLTLFVGQSAIYMTLGLYVALRYARIRPALATLGVALTGVKPTFGLPLGILLLARGTWRPAVAGGALVALASAALAVPMARAAGGFGPWLASLGGASDMTDDPHNVIVQSYVRVDTASLVGRLVQVEPSTAVQALLMVLVLATGAAAVRRLGRTSGSHAPLSAGVVCATTLACVYHQTYDCLLLLAPLFGSVAGTVARGRWRWPLATLLLVPFVNYFATLTAIQMLGIQGAGWRLVASLNAAAVTGALLVLLREAATAPSTAPRDPVRAPERPA
jgi:hypothetical protein